MLAVKQEWMEACMRGWMTGGMNREESGTLAGLFILYAYTPNQDICDANSAQESQLCLLGSSLCVGVSGCILRRYLYAICPLFGLPSLNRLIVVLNYHRRHHLSIIFKAVPD